VWLGAVGATYDRRALPWWLKMTPKRGAEQVGSCPVLYFLDDDVYF
jgi:hypothetical protein